MLKRLWAVVAGGWAIAFLWNGSTKADGVGAGDIYLAFAPLALGWVLARVARFVATGSVRRQPYRVYKP